MTNFSRLPEFIRNSHTITMHLKIKDHFLGTSPIVKPAAKEKPEFFPQPFYSVELPPVFCHMSFLLIETLAETQHGEFVTRSKQGKYETMVELCGHISHRYKLSPQELEEMQQLYDRIYGVFWQQYRKKT
ncbi:hypothetical protein [Nostoc sp. CCY0012]|uniref:hypothetical protein n=1 Tax=Nostoc sp. CCY0012 TaxID=1056123 RepID=UPI0039C5EC72